jgi:D-alanyl-D-alanine carboxypeptidase
MQVIHFKSNQSKSKKRFPSVKKELLLAAALVIVLVGFWESKVSSPTLHNSIKPTTTFNKAEYSVNDPTSIWVVVNKGRSLPAKYIPSDLVVPNIPLRLPATDPEMQLNKPAARELEYMVENANSDGYQLKLASGYRSYTYQVGLYNGYVNKQGQTSADASSARAGHSEHQTGLAADLEPADRQCEVELCFADTAEGRWLAENAYKYGFIIRYQKGQENLTGYEYEPWHVRFVGKELALQIHKNAQTLEQFFDLPNYTNYPSKSYQLTVGG